MKISPWVILSLLGTGLMLLKKTSPTPTINPVGDESRTPAYLLDDASLAEVINNPLNFPAAYVAAAVAEGVKRVAARPTTQAAPVTPSPAQVSTPAAQPKPAWSEQAPDSYGQTVINTGSPDEIWNYFKDSNNIEGVRAAAQKLAALGDTRAADLNYLLSQILVK